MSFPSVIPAEVTDLFKSFNSIPHSSLQTLLTSHHGQALISLLLSTIETLASSCIQKPSFKIDQAQKHATKTTLNLVNHLLELKEKLGGGGAGEGRKVLELILQLANQSNILNICLAGEFNYPKLVRKIVNSSETADQASNILISVEEVLKDRMMELQDSSYSSVEAMQSIFTSIRILSRLNSIFKLVTLDSEEVISIVKSLQEVYNFHLPSFADKKGWQSFNHQNLNNSINQDSPNWLGNWLEIKFEILQVFQNLFQLFKSKSSPSSFSKLLEVSFSTTSSSSPPPQIRAPLISLSLLSDLNLISPSTLKHPSSDSKVLGIISKVKEEAHSALVAIGSPSTSISIATPKFSGPAWELLKSEVKSSSYKSQAPTSNKVDKGKGKVRAVDWESQPQIDSNLLKLVSSILPHLSTGSEGEMGLKRRLGSKRYFGKSNEEVLQMILDEEEKGIPEEEIISNSRNPDIRSITPPPFNDTLNFKKQPSSRANIFDQQPLDMSKLRWRGSNQLTSDEISMSNDLKAQILARVEAQEKEQLEEEWDLEGEVNGNGSNQRGFGMNQEVGFEEEIEDEEPQGIHRRQGISSLGGINANASDWKRRLEDLSDEEDEEQDEDLTRMEGKGVPMKTNSNDLPASNQISNVERERNDERILVKAWSTLGEGAFDKEARKSKDRKNLLSELGGGWDDHRVESWATMFNRNPRKDKLLSSANDLLTPNLNRAPAPTQRSSDEQNSRFGPDRGRGGRLPRGGRGGSETSGGGRGGGPESGSGSAGGGTRGRGTHSGNDRGARQKEKRGNSARQRGFDRKSARGAAGTGAL